jgi:hypothetical protein
MTVQPGTVTGGQSRWVWLWCLAYTTLTPAAARQRRREEIRSHLWESTAAGLPAKAIAWAAVRGAVHDLTWAMACGVPALGRSFGTPTPYVVLAPLFPVQAWMLSAVAVGTTAHVAEGAGAIGGGAMLALAGLVWLVRRRVR